MSEFLIKKSDGADFDPLYTKRPELGATYPGAFPYLRGTHPTMYRGQLWTLRQYSGFGSPQQTNGRFKELLNSGQSGLSLAFDLPTQMGFDPDDAHARGEVGRVGVSIATVDDLKEVFDSISLEKISTSMTINSTASILLSFYIEVAKQHNLKPNVLRGTTQNDILKEFIARGTYVFPPKASLRLTTDVNAYAAEHLPLWNPISISGYHIREAGSDAAQELAFTLSNAQTYAQDLLDRGLKFDDFAQRFSFFFAAHTNVLEEVSKFRAARVLWATIAKEKFGSQNPHAQMLRFHVQTGGSTLTAQQIENNTVRTTLQALSAILGGAQSLHTNAKDEALALPTVSSALLALRTQQILAHESGITNTIDPLGGSYAVESLTQNLIAQASELLSSIEKMGGSLRCLENQFFQKKIADRAFEYQNQIEQGERKIVGVNCYEEKEPTSIPTLKIDPAQEKSRIEKIAHYKKNRNNSAVVQSLQRLKKMAQTQTNLMPSILDCAQSRATLGEISGTLREVFGEYRPQ